jgi:hypothetical protein
VTLKLGTTFQTWAKNYLRENGLRLILTKDLFAYKFHCVCMLFLGTYTNQVYLLIEMVNSNSRPYVIGANLSRQLLFCRTDFAKMYNLTSPEIIRINEYLLSSLRSIKTGEKKRYFKKLETLKTECFKMLTLWCDSI